MKLSDKETKAQELIECLGMWGLSVNDSLHIVQIMKVKLREITVMPNPLKDSGLKVAGPNDKTINHIDYSNPLYRSRVQHEPESEQ